MIQRIQTIYLSAVIVLCCMMFIMPMAKFQITKPGETAEYVFNLLHTVDNVTKQPVNFGNTWLITITAICMLLVSALTIFLYKQRTVQLIIARLNLYVSFIFIGMLYFFIERELHISYGDGNANLVRLPAGYFPIVIIVLLILAVRGIKKDEELIKSADRLR